MRPDPIEITISKESTKALDDLADQIKILNVLSAEAFIRIGELRDSMRELPWYVRLILAMKG